jgi:hypothetical protein
VGDLVRTPRALPVPISGDLNGVDAVVSQSRLVANTLPVGSNWDGQSGLLVDEKTYNELIGAREPPSETQAPAQAQAKAQTQVSVR